MDLLARAGEVLRAENDAYDSEPESIGVGTLEHKSDAEYEITGRFPAEQADDDIVAPSEDVHISEGDEMYPEINAVFERVRSGVSVAPAEITSIHLTTTSSGEGLPDEWSFYTSETADARFFIGVESQPSASPREKLLQAFVEGARELDSTLTTEDVVNAEFYFSDMHVCRLQSAKGHVRTSRPFAYYTDVESVEEYTQVIADNAEELADLRAQDSYEAFVRLDENGEFETETVRDVGERVMWSFVEETLDTDWESIVECGAAMIGEFEEDFEAEMMKYHVNIPVVDGEIGQTR